MKIEGPGSQNKKITALGAPKEGHRVVGGKGLNFGDVLSDNERHARKEQLDQLLKDLDEQAEALKGNRSLATLRRYRELVKSFLETAVGETYHVREEVGVDRRGRRRLFILVGQVNDALEELTKMVLDAQKPGLEILDKLGEIRGMLVDLYT